MKKWEYKIDIKQHLIEDGDFKDFALAANNVAKEFQNSLKVCLKIILVSKMI